MTLSDDPAWAIDAEPGDMVKTARGAHRVSPWERVVGGILIGPGYAFDLENDEIVSFVSPSAPDRLEGWPRQVRPADKYDAGESA